MWNGRSMMGVLNHSASSTVELYTDASGSWGCGAFWLTTGRWIQCQWPQHWITRNISVKEMFPIVLAMAIWGKLCSHQRILVYCDNMAVVEITITKTSRDKEIMHLLRCLHFFTAIFDMDLKVLHIECKSNAIADAISRSLLQILRREVSQPHLVPDRIPWPLWRLLIETQLDWTLWHCAMKLCQANLSINSQRTYGTAQKQFLQFCHNFSMPPLPASEQTLILFTADMSQSLLHISEVVFIGRTTFSYCKLVRRPIKRCIAIRVGAERKKPRGQDTRLPITPLVLKRIKQVLMLNPHDYNNIMLWAACCLAFL